MKKKRILFDFDGTIIDSKYTHEGDLFKSHLFEEEFDRLDVNKILLDYEDTFYRYDIDAFIRFAKSKYNITFTRELMEKWIDLGDDDDSKLFPDTIETLDYLKHKGCSLAICSNWFTRAQIRRVNEFGLSDYFDDIRGGDFVLKPNKDAFLGCIGEFRIEECIMIGDSYYKDYVGPISMGMDAIYVNRKNDNNGGIKQLKKIKEIL